VKGIIIISSLPTFVEIKFLCAWLEELIEPYQVSKRIEARRSDNDAIQKCRHRRLRVLARLAWCGRGDRLSGGSKQPPITSAAVSDSFYFRIRQVSATACVLPVRTTGIIHIFCNSIVHYTTTSHIYCFLLQYCSSSRRTKLHIQTNISWLVLQNFSLSPPGEMEP
jgi:hypothetical protein